MWKKLLDTEYFFQLGSELEVFITNYVSMWRYQFTEAEFLECMQLSNEGLEIDERDLVQKGKQIFKEPERLKRFWVNLQDNMLCVTLMNSFGFPVWVEMNLPEVSPELFFRKITQPLLRSVQDLRASQQELIHLLKKKDLEIEEYKCEGGEIALRFLKTIPFRDEAHISKHTVYNELFGPDDVPDFLLNKTVRASEDRRVVKEEPKEDQSTTETQTNSSKSETEIKTEPIKMEFEIDIEEHNLEPPAPASTKTEKTELETQLSPSSRTTNRRPGTIGASPSKRQRKKLNL